jgi:hypothetical protein
MPRHRGQSHGFLFFDMALNFFLSVAIGKDLGRALPAYSKLLGEVRGPAWVPRPSSQTAVYPGCLLLPA